MCVCVCVREREIEIERVREREREREREKGEKILLRSQHFFRGFFPKRSRDSDWKTLSHFALKILQR